MCHIQLFVLIGTLNGWKTCCEKSFCTNWSSWKWAHCKLLNQAHVRFIRHGTYFMFCCTHCTTVRSLPELRSNARCFKFKSYLVNKTLVSLRWFSHSGPCLTLGSYTQKMSSAILLLPFNLALLFLISFLEFHLPLLFIASTRSVLKDIE